MLSREHGGGGHDKLAKLWNYEILLEARKSKSVKELNAKESSILIMITNSPQAVWHAISHFIN